MHEPLPDSNIAPRSLTTSTLHATQGRAAGDAGRPDAGCAQGGHSLTAAGPTGPPGAFQEKAGCACTEGAAKKQTRRQGDKEIPDEVRAMVMGAV